MSDKQESVLFYTCVNTKFWGFGMIYPLFVLMTNPGAKVEIGVENYRRFHRKYRHISDFYDKYFPGKVLFSPVAFDRWTWHGRQKIVPNSVRFATQPKLKADYVYIGDADILITEEVASQHLANIEKHHLDFSNVVRKGRKRLTGLHFIAYDKMYPLPSLRGINLGKCNDEDLLYRIIQRKRLKMPGPEVTFRPAHGLHISLYSSSPFEYLVGPNHLLDFPAWFMAVDSKHNIGNQDMGVDVDKYFDLRKRPEFIAFYEILKPKDTEVRRIIQITDACAYYYKHVILQQKNT